MRSRIWGGSETAALDDLLVYAVALVASILLSAFFSGSEAALFSLNRSQINRLARQSRPGRQVQSLLTYPRRILVTILMGNLVVNVFATSAATSVAVGLFGDKGVVIAFFVMSVLIIVLGETFPKVIAINRPRRFSLVAVYPLRMFHTLFYPARWPMTLFADTVVETLKKRLGLARRYFSQGELLTAFDMGRDQGSLGEFEHHLLSSIIEFRDTTVKEIMTPSISVFSLPISTSVEDMLENIVQTKYSRVPVYGETPDDIRGVVHIKELAAGPRPGSDGDISDMIRPPYYVPESTKIAQLFKELGRRRSQLALVIDEYGSYVGVVTMEDILEELVGEIYDAKEQRTENYRLVDDKRIIVLGTMEIDQFNGVFHEAITDSQHETIAGYVIGVTGRIPREGETIDVEGLRFHIISAQPNRIRKMRVEKI